MNPGGREVIFARACCGNEAALSFLTGLFNAADIADDIHDGDRTGGMSEVLLTMSALNLNPFFRAHCDELTALMITGSLSWDISNGLNGHPQQQFYADQLEQVLFYVAVLCGGYAHAKDVALEWIAV